MVPINSCMYKGVLGEITSVKRLRKKSVAFGFKTLVRKPIFIADRGELSCFLLLCIFRIEFFYKNEKF